jgi:hypothetical protein
MQRLPDDVLSSILNHTWGVQPTTFVIDGSRQCEQRLVLLRACDRFRQLLAEMSLQETVDAHCDAVAASAMALVGGGVKHLTLRCPSNGIGVPPQRVLQHAPRLVSVDLRLDADAKDWHASRTASEYPLRSMGITLPRSLRRMRVEFDPEWLEVARRSGCPRLRSVDFATEPAYFENGELRFCSLVNQLRSVRRLRLTGVSPAQARVVLRHIGGRAKLQLGIVMEDDPIDLLGLGDLGLKHVRALVRTRYQDGGPPVFAYPSDDVEALTLGVEVVDAGPCCAFEVDATAPPALRYLRVAAAGCAVTLDFAATFATLAAGHRRDVVLVADAVHDKRASPTAAAATEMLPPPGARWTLAIEGRSLPMALLFALRRAGAAFELQDRGAGAAPRAVAASHAELLPPAAHA